MTLGRLVKYGLAIGSVGCFVAVAVLGVWPSILNITRAPLYVAQIGALCVFAGICYLTFRFVRAGLSWSRRM